MNNKNNDVAISVKGISKYFSPTAGQQTIKHLFANLFKSKSDVKKGGYWALKNINFDIKKGEFFGIVGRNGSGKSTLLKLMAGVYTPTDGAVAVEGKLVPFIELGVGFNPELSGRDNVFLNGALLGFSRREIESMYDEIVEFAELKDHMEVKLKNFSSGMQVRLAFSIAIRAKADILLIDEVLAVGDAAFQQKCIEYFHQLKNDKKTIVLVTHDMSVVKSFCDRAVIINEGGLDKVGSPRDIASMYEVINLDSMVRSDVDSKHDVSKIKTVVLDNNLKRKKIFKHGDEIIIKMSWPNEIRSTNAGVSIHKNGVYVFGANTFREKIEIGNTINFYAKLNLGSGKYKISSALFKENPNSPIAFSDESSEFVVLPSSKDGEINEWDGITCLKHKWSVKEL